MKAIPAFAIALLAASTCTSPPPSLLQLDVTGDQLFSDVTLRLQSDGGVSKTIGPVTFDQSQTVYVGLYLPSSIKGDIEIRAAVDDGTCIRGMGMVTVPGVASGQTTVRVNLEIVHTNSCVPPPPDGVGGTSGASGSGGANGTGGSLGSGGSTGSGGMVIGTGGRVGTGGSGGQIGLGGMGVGGRGTGGSSSGGATGTGGGGPGGNCGLLIDDMETVSGQICEGNGRVGHWFTYVDAYPTSSITPVPSSVSAARPDLVLPMRDASRYATHASGRFSSYAGIGCLLNNALIGQAPKTYDATSHTGIHFWAKGLGGLTVNINTSATVSTAYGGTCSAISCVGATYRVVGLYSSIWSEFTVPFSQLTSGSAIFRAADVWSIEFQPNVLGSYDLWIDDLTFY